MARCPHGFERSVVPCATCSALDRRYGSGSARAIGAPSRPPRGRGANPIGRAEVITKPGEYACRKCGETKPLSEFYVSRKSSLGHQSRCKLCDNGDRIARIGIDPNFKKSETAKWKARALAAEGRMRVTRQWVANLVQRLDDVIAELPDIGIEGGDDG